MLQIVAVHFSKKEQVLFLKEHAKRQEALKDAIARIRDRRPILRAEDLIQEGIEPGVRMGKLLKEAERIAANEGLSAKEAVMNRLKKSDLWIIP